MQRCNFQPAAGDVLQCSNCGATVRTDREPARVHRRCGASPPAELLPFPRPTCTHQGNLLETVACDMCGLKGQAVEVFACALHDRCSATRRHSKVRSCAACEDYMEVPPPH